ncbi:hypothetical protein [Flexivirga meconopsidis]|uniref:hypothetical protein n=1 Tax=Flexivirga meconopsidis TaxID=2977121 RepID=UPI00223FEEEE|nr:hypothetical protein [Flexivirga meconopsidis]
MDLDLQPPSAGVEPVARTVLVCATGAVGELLPSQWSSRPGPAAAGPGRSAVVPSVLAVARWLRSLSRTDSAVVLPIDSCGQPPGHGPTDLAGRLLAAEPRRLLVGAQLAPVIGPMVAGRWELTRVREGGAEPVLALAQLRAAGALADRPLLAWALRTPEPAVVADLPRRGRVRQLTGDPAVVDQQLAGLLIAAHHSGRLVLSHRAVLGDRSRPLHALQALVESYARRRPVDRARWPAVPGTADGVTSRPVHRRLDDLLKTLQELSAAAETVLLLRDVEHLDKSSVIGLEWLVGASRLSLIVTSAEPRPDLVRRWHRRLPGFETAAPSGTFERAG